MIFDCCFVMMEPGRHYNFDRTGTLYLCMWYVQLLSYGYCDMEFCGLRGW